MASPEVWLRGPLEDIPPVLQPAAHALLQAQEEIHLMLASFPERLLWEKPFGVASVAFHLQHIAGVLDRLGTYAKGEQLSPDQLTYLSNEGIFEKSISLDDLIVRLDKKIAELISFMRLSEPASLFDPRFVGRKMLPSTTLGLLFHCAEHTMRHTGQMHVTVGVVQQL